MFENFGEKLTRKMGPFPVWVWGVLIGGAFVAYYWFSNGFASSDDSGDGSEEDSGGTGVGQTPGPSGDFSTVPVLPSEEDPVTDENTNGEWLIQAMNAAKTLPGVSLLAAQTALEKYLNGVTLSAAEGAIVEQILRRVGQPPQGVAGPPDVTPETPTPEAPKPITKDFSTKTTLSAGWVRNPLIIRAKVDWVNPKGHTWKPRGTVNIGINGTNRKAVMLANGNAIRPVVVGRNKALVITATYHPAKGVSEKSSKASPLAIRTK